MNATSIPKKLSEVTGIDRAILWFLHSCLKHRLAPMVVEKIRQAELQRVKEDIAKQTGRPLNASDVHARATDKFDQITCPVVFRRMVPGRKPELHLRVTQEIARRIEQLHFGTAMAGKTIDVVFLIPKGLMKRAEPVPQDVEEN